MHSECRKMHHFASRFDKISRGDTPNPLWNGTQTVTEPLGNFPPKATVFHLNFQNKCVQNVGKCTISHLDLENFPGVAPQTPFGEGHKVLL